MKIKVVSLWQPHASLIPLKAKRIETRSWPTSYRGLLAIHAAKNMTWMNENIFNTQPFFKVLVAAGLFNYRIDPMPKLPYGAIVGVCELLHCAQISEITSFPACKGYAWKGREWKLDEQERAFGNYTAGRYMWLLANARPLPEPIPTRGYQGLWDVEISDDVLATAMETA